MRRRNTKKDISKINRYSINSLNLKHLIPLIDHQYYYYEKSSKDEIINNIKSLYNFLYPVLSEELKNKQFHICSLYDLFGILGAEVSKLFLDNDSIYRFDIETNSILRIYDYSDIKFDPFCLFYTDFMKEDSSLEFNILIDKMLNLLFLSINFWDSYYFQSYADMALDVDEYDEKGLEERKEELSIANDKLNSILSIKITAEDFISEVDSFNPKTLFESEIKSTILSFKDVFYEEIRLMDYSKRVYDLEIEDIDYCECVHFMFDENGMSTQEVISWIDNDISNIGISYPIVSSLIDCYGNEKETKSKKNLDLLLNFLNTINDVANTN